MRGYVLASAFGLVAAGYAQAPTTTTIAGCVQVGARPGSFVLSVVPTAPVPVGTSGTPAPAVTPSLIELIGGGNVSIGEHAGHQVEATGSLVGERRSARTPVGTTGGSAPTARLNVRTIRQIGPCTQTAATTTPATASGGGRQNGLSGAATSDYLLKGLLAADVQRLLARVITAANTNTNIPGAIVDASTVLNATQIDGLLRAIDGSSAATANADDIASGLRERGLLRADERVIGVSSGTIYKAATVK